LVRHIPSHLYIFICVLWGAHNKTWGKKYKSPGFVHIYFCGALYLVEEGDLVGRKVEAADSKLTHLIRKKLVYFGAAAKKCSTFSMEMPHSKMRTGFILGSAVSSNNK
jgi:hypothetical protein